MNNSLLGKTMKKSRKKINVRLVSNAKDYLKYLSKLTFISQKTFSKNFGTIHEIKPGYSVHTSSRNFFTTLSRKKK